MPIVQICLSRKKRLSKVNSEFAWEVMRLEVGLFETEEPSMEEVMKLIQLYMVKMLLLSQLSKFLKATMIRDIDTSIRKFIP